MTADARASIAGSATADSDLERVLVLPALRQLSVWAKGERAARRAAIEKMQAQSMRDAQAAWTQWASKKERRQVCAMSAVHVAVLCGLTVYHRGVRCEGCDMLCCAASAGEAAVH
jgi:hypothetical protein